MNGLSKNFSTFFKNHRLELAKSDFHVVWVVKGEIHLSPAFAAAKGGEYLE